MALIDEFATELRKINQKLVEEGLTLDDNVSIKNGKFIEWSGKKDISYTLKNMEYSIIYQKIKEKRDFTFLLFDGGIIQVMYEFDSRGREIQKHRLAYYPNTELPSFGIYAEDYEDEELFSENIYSTPIVVPIRFDFDKNSFIDNEHPYSHVTLGGYKNCRIPAFSPISPLQFMQFILKSFYFEKYKDCFVGTTFFSCISRFSNTITNNERKNIHFNLEY